MAEDLVEITSDVVSAYIRNNPVQQIDLPKLILSIHQAFVSISHAKPETSEEELKPAVPLRKSITPDYIICLEDGQKFRSMKRHLRSRYNLSPEEYREKWGLPSDYPMVAPNYAAMRSELAKKIGLGGDAKQAHNRTRKKGGLTTA